MSARIATRGRDMNILFYKKNKQTYGLHKLVIVPIYVSHLIRILFSLPFGYNNKIQWNARRSSTDCFVKFIFLACVTVLIAAIKCKG